MAPESCSSPTYRLPTTNYLFFQRHSCFKLVTTCFFYNIPALQRVVQSLPFVFIEIRALFVRFLRLRSFSFPPPRLICCPKRQSSSVHLSDRVARSQSLAPDS